MKAKNYLALAILSSSLVVPSAASAGDKTGIGVGAESFLTSELDVFGASPGVATLTYDASLWRVSGMLTMVTYEDSVSFLGVGGRFYYPVHSRHDSDFSVGGGAAIVNTNPEGPGDSDTSVHIEAGVQLRAFLTNNVAVSTSLGLGILMADDDGPSPDETSFGLLGQLVGSLGITYFFW